MGEKVAMRKSLLISLAITLVVTLAAFTATLIAGNKPLLGLDLQGGASVVLAPDQKVDTKVLDTTISIIRNRVDGLGVSEPEISREGNNVLVQLPGVKDQKKALEQVGTTAELRFRPVLTQVPIDPNFTPATTTTAVGATTTTLAGATTTTAVGATTTTLAGATTTTAVGSTTTSVGSTTTTTIDPAVVAPASQCATTSSAKIATTKPEEDDPTKTVVLPQYDSKKNITARYCLGPSQLIGNAVSDASVEYPNGSSVPVVGIKFTGAGLTAFNQIAQTCYAGGATCPSRSVAIVLDGVVKSAPRIQPDKTAFEPFTSNGVQISGGGSGMSRSEADSLALVLKYGSLPVKLTPQSVTTVSATLGKDSLRAGIISGLIGLALVVLFMLVYYRILGLVVLGGLIVSSMLLYSLVTYFNATMTLSGIAGIIVSIGVTVDSYVVYFEKLKDEVRLGKTIRSSAERGFKSAYRTILAADASSFIGAALLYILTEGSVKGFAFFLGVSTLLDMITAFMFTRPLVILVTRTKLFAKDRVLGIPVAQANRVAGVVR